MIYKVIHTGADSAVIYYAINEGVEGQLALKELSVKDGTHVNFSRSLMVNEKDERMRKHREILLFSQRAIKVIAIPGTDNILIYSYGEGTMIDDPIPRTTMTSAMSLCDATLANTDEARLRVIYWGLIFSRKAELVGIYYKSSIYPTDIESHEGVKVFRLEKEAEYQASDPSHIVKTREELAKILCREIVNHHVAITNDDWKYKLELILSLYEEDSSLIERVSFLNYTSIMRRHFPLTRGVSLSCILTQFMTQLVKSGVKGGHIHHTWYSDIMYDSVTPESLNVSAIVKIMSVSLGEIICRSITVSRKISISMSDILTEDISPCLHLFLCEAPHRFAIRADFLSNEDVQTIPKLYTVDYYRYLWELLKGINTNKLHDNLYFILDIPSIFGALISSYVPIDIIVRMMEEAGEVVHLLYNGTLLLQTRREKIPEDWYLLGQACISPFGFHQYAVNGKLYGNDTLQYVRKVGPTEQNKGSGTLFGEELYARGSEDYCIHYLHAHNCHHVRESLTAGQMKEIEALKIVRVDQDTSDLDDLFFMIEENGKQSTKPE